MYRSNILTQICFLCSIFPPSSSSLLQNEPRSGGVRLGFLLVFVGVGGGVDGGSGFVMREKKTAAA